jgi:hypothetical protein
MLPWTPTVDFWEKLALLLSAAALSGLLAPLVLKQFEMRRTAEQKVREAQLARQAKLIDAQSALLDDLSRVLWEWRYAAMRVTYYGGLGDQERCTEANAAYGDVVWGLLSQIRFHTSRARWLISTDAFERLKAFYLRLIEIDLALYRAGELDDPVKRSLELADMNQVIFGQVTSDIDTILADIAAEAMISVTPAAVAASPGRADARHR